MERLRGWAVVAFVLATGFLTLGVEGYAVHSYGWPGQTLNGGLVLNVPNDWYGVELWGNPGVFHHVD